MIKKTLTLNLPENEMIALTLIAEITNETKTTVIRQALRSYRKSKAVSRLIDNNKDNPVIIKNSKEIPELEGTRDALDKLGI